MKYFLLYSHFNGEIDEFFGIFNSREEALLYQACFLEDKLLSIDIEEVEYFPFLR